MKLYIVMETAFAYNDEIYYSENDGGLVTKAFKSKEKADECALEKNITFLKEEDLNCYGYSADEIADDEAWALLFGEEADDKIEEMWDGSLNISEYIKKLDKVQLEKLVGYVHVCPFYVQEVEVEK